MSDASSPNKQEPTATRIPLSSLRPAEWHYLVWRVASPVKLAKVLGVSDVAVRKHCHKVRVPTPMREYWARPNFDPLTDVLVPAFASAEEPEIGSGPADLKRFSPFGLRCLSETLPHVDIARRFGASVRKIRSLVASGLRDLELRAQEDVQPAAPEIGDPGESDHGAGDIVNSAIESWLMCLDPGNLNRSVASVRRCNARRGVALIAEEEVRELGWPALETWAVDRDGMEARLALALRGLNEKRRPAVASHTRSFLRYVNGKLADIRPCPPSIVPDESIATPITEPEPERPPDPLEQDVLPSFYDEARFAPQLHRWQLRRDLAMVALVECYGLKAQEIIALTLGDWRRASASGVLENGAPDRDVRMAAWLEALLSRYVSSRPGPQAENLRLFVTNRQLPCYRELVGETVAKLFRSSGRNAATPGELRDRFGRALLIREDRTRLQRHLGFTRASHGNRLLRAS